MPQNQNSINQQVVNNSIITLAVGPLSTFLGDSAGSHITSGQHNTGVGAGALDSTTIGGNNTAVGHEAMINNVSGNSNVAVGYSALTNNNNDNNTAVGFAALAANSSGTQNTALGYGALATTISGSHSTGLGGNSLIDATGDFNCAVGYNSGTAYTGSESNNIVISNVGVLGESNVLRIGTQGSGAGEQNICYIAGITGATPVSGNTPQVVLCDNTGNLTPISSGTSGFVLTSNGSATPSFQAPSSGGTVWNVISASQTLAVNNGYICVSPGGALALALPATSAVGNIIEVVLNGATSWQITQAAGQEIFIANTHTTIGAGGSLTSTAQGDAVRLVCSVANTTWIAVSGFIGNLTVV
jgi:hypothetical protein